MSADRAWPRHSLLWMWTILIAGALLRIAQYCSNRSLWCDEALLALNVLHRSWSGLLKPLDYNQGAPIGFLLLEKLSAEILGGSEFALRLVPLLAGVSSLFVFWRVARRCVSTRAAMVAFGLFAISFPLIYYSSEVKQYSTDVFVNLFLLTLLLEPWAGQLLSRRTHRLGLGGAAAIWFSHPASFVLAGFAITSALFLRARREWDGFRALAALFAVWAFSFVTCYLISLRRLTQNAMLLDFWRDQFPPFPLRSVHNLPWLADRTLELVRDSAGLDAPLGAAFVLAGLGSMFLRDKKALGLIVAPAGLAVLASPSSMPVATTAQI